MKIIKSSVVGVDVGLHGAMVWYDGNNYEVYSFLQEVSPHKAAGGRYANSDRPCEQIDVRGLRQMMWQWSSSYWLLERPCAYKSNTDATNTTLIGRFNTISGMLMLNMPVDGNREDECKFGSCSVFDWRAFYSYPRGMDRSEIKAYSVDLAGYIIDSIGKLNILQTDDEAEAFLLAFYAYHKVNPFANYKKVQYCKEVISGL